MESENITVFLSRSGVINGDKGRYLKKWSEFEFIPHIFKVLRVFKERGYRVIIVTNQCGIGKGLMTIEDVDMIHFMMKLEVFKNGGEIHSVHFCPHIEEEDCMCRKPKPGLLFQAKKKFPDIDFSHSFMIGDRWLDMDAASAIGIKTCFLIDKLTDLHRCRVEPDFCIADIAQAINLVPTYFENKELHKNGVGLEEYKKNYKNL